MSGWLQSRKPIGADGFFKVASRLFLASVFLFTPLQLFALQSTNYSIPKLVENNGSGFRVGSSYQLTLDVISPQPVETSSSTNYTLQGQPLVLVDSAKSSCGIYVNENEYGTADPDVTLNLVCGHPSGCASVQISDTGGVFFEPPVAYSTSMPWTLTGGDGNKTIFARYINSDGITSGKCSDSIWLDTTAPSLGISPTGGTYFSTQQIAMTASEPSTVTYTDDGSDPTTSPTALEYSGPVNVSTNQELKAYAVDLSGNTGSVVTEEYEICGGNNFTLSGFVIDATTNLELPLVSITLENLTQSTTHMEATELDGSYAFTGLERGFVRFVSIEAPVPGYSTYQADIKLCENSVVHDITLTRSATVFGTDTNSGYSVDSVNTSTGNFTTSVLDFAVPGIGQSVVFERTYNSQDPTDGPLGFGWTWNYNTQLGTGPDGEVVVRWGDGRTEVWAPDGMGGYMPMYGVFSALTDNMDGTFTLQRKDLISYHFDTSGRLAEIEDEYGNSILFSFTGSDLTEITDTAGRTIDLSYDASGRITNVLDPIGRSISFTYDGNGNLVSSNNMEGEVTTYTYDSNHQMTVITDPLMNDVVTAIYDASRRVVTSQRDALGGETNYSYDVPTKTTIITDAGGNTTIHKYDDLLRLVEEIDANGDSVLYEYDMRGNMSKVTDRRGIETSYDYDPNGNVIQKTEAVGTPVERITTATFDASNNPLTKTDANGHSQLFEYDPVNGNLLIFYDCGGVAIMDCDTDPTVTRTEYGYDPATGQMLSVTEAAGHPTLERTTSYEYDLEGNQVKVTDALSNFSEFTFDGVGRKITESHPLGRGAFFTYDNMDQLVSTTNVYGDTATFVYDANGNKIEHIEENAHSTQFEYDEKNRLIKTTFPDGEFEEYVYDALDRRTEVINRLGRSSRVVFDAVGNVVNEIDALNNTTMHLNDENGNVTATTNARNYTTLFTYDELNRLTLVADPLFNMETYEYDAVGNQTRVVNSLGEEVVTTYDAFNRVATVSDHLGNTVTNTYDALGRLIQVEDARGNSTHFVYDLLDRLVEVTDGASGMLSATYDALGNRTSVTDTRGNTTEYEYDLLDRLTRESGPVGEPEVITEEMNYDAVGNLVSLINADGETTYGYDSNDRLVGIGYPDLTTATYTYDANGNRLTVTDTAGLTTFEYDQLDRIKLVTDVFGNRVSYGYDANGNRIAIGMPDFLKTVSYAFDELDRLVQVTDWDAVTTNYTYDDAGRLASELMGNSSSVTYEIDSAGRPTGKIDRAPDDSIISSFQYTLDENGNPVSQTFAQPVMPDVQDLQSLLTSNAANQVTDFDANSYTYDGKGNRTSRISSSGTTTYQYDTNNRLIEINDGTSITNHTYTSNGVRVASEIDGEQTRYLVDINSPIESVLVDLDDSNNPQKYFVHGMGLAYSVEAQTGAKEFYHFDLTGSTVALSNQLGEIVGGYSYLPYGEVLSSQSGESNQFTFNGRFGVRQESNDLYFMRARFYDSETRSFLSPDEAPSSVARPYSFNRYAFAWGNPLVIADPNGEDGGLLAAVIATYVVVTGVTDTVNFALDLPDTYRNEGWDGVTTETIKWGVGLKNLPASEAIAAQQGFEDGFNGSARDPLQAHGSYHAAYWLGGKSKEPLLNATEGSREASATVASGGDVVIGVPGMKRIWISNPLHSTSSTSGLRNPLTPTTEAVIEQTSGDDAPQPERSVRLKVGRYARNFYSKEFAKILNPGFLDQRTRSFVEHKVALEVNLLSQKRITYRKSSEQSRRKAREQRERLVRESANRLYAQLLSALSKHQVVIGDLSELPDGTSGGIVKSGIFAGN